MPAATGSKYDISIHVLRVEDDYKEVIACKSTHNFNPRPPCGGRPLFTISLNYDLAFQSTSSVWRTTLEWLKEEHATIFQSTSSVWRTTMPLLTSTVLASFQSTSSVWRTTYSPHKSALLPTISIHVLRVEDDRLFALLPSVNRYFNPRPPCGGRRGRAGGAHPGGVISIHVLRVEDDLA